MRRRYNEEEEEEDMMIDLDTGMAAAPQPPPSWDAENASEAKPVDAVEEPSAPAAGSFASVTK